MPGPFFTTTFSIRSVRFFFTKGKTPGAVTAVIGHIGKTADAFAVDTGVNDLCKAAVFDEPYWLTGVKGHAFTASGGLYPAL